MLRPNAQSRTFLRALATPHNRRCRRACSPPPKPRSATRVQAHAAGPRRPVRSRKGMSAARRRSLKGFNASGRTQNIVPPKKSNLELIGRNAHTFGDLQRHGAIGRPGEIFGITGLWQSEHFRADHPNRRIALEHVDGGIRSARRAQQIEQQPPSPHVPHIGLAAAVDRFLPVDLANVAVAIEPAPFQQEQERANVAAAILHDLNFGRWISAPNRFDQPFTTRNCRDDQIEGNRQAPKSAPQCRTKCPHSRYGQRPPPAHSREDP